MPKDNLLFKLDNLEYQQHYLNNTLDSFEPRLNQTRKFYNAKGRKTIKKVEKLLNEIKIEDVERQLNEIKLEIFDKKIHHFENNLTKNLIKLLENENSKLIKNFDKTTLEAIKNQYGIPQFAKLLCLSKSIKLTTGKIVPKSKKIEDTPQWFVKHNYWEIYQDKNNEFNPSRIWNEVIMKIKKSDALVSLIMNDKKVKDIIQSFENGMDVFLGINKGKKLQREKNGLNKASSSNNEVEMQEDDASEDDELTERPALRRETRDEDQEIDEDEILNQYEGMLAASDDEEGEEASFWT